MSFTLTNEDGAQVEQIYSCTECLYSSTKRHFFSSGEGLKCVLCKSPAEKIGTQIEQTGMPAYRYQQLLTYLEEEVSGVGQGTVSSIEEHFEEGDDFLDAAAAAYRDRNFEPLLAVDGIGESTAENIGLGIAETEGWSDGLLESKFALSES